MRGNRIARQKKHRAHSKSAKSSLLPTARAAFLAAARPPNIDLRSFKVVWRRAWRKIWCFLFRRGGARSNRRRRPSRGRAAAAAARVKAEGRVKAKDRRKVSVHSTYLQQPQCCSVRCFWSSSRRRFLSPPHFIINIHQSPPQEAQREQSFSPFFYLDMPVLPLTGNVTPGDTSTTNYRGRGSGLRCVGRVGCVSK